MLGFLKEKKIKDQKEIEPEIELEIEPAMIQNIVEIIDEKVIKNNILMIKIASIEKNPYQPRTYFDQNELNNLKESIKENGLIQPLAVRLMGNDKYELIAGERRLRACRLLGMEEVSCYIIDCDDKKSSILALTENIQRNNLTYFEEAKAYLYMLQSFRMTQMELSQKFSKSQSAIANKIRLLKFNSMQQSLIIANHLTERQCRALLKLEDSNELDNVIKHIKKYQLNTKQTEDYIEKVNIPPKKTKRHLILKDVRCFINTIEKAIDIMNESGINAKTQKKEVEGMIEYTIKIPTALQAKIH